MGDIISKEEFEKIKPYLDKPGLSDATVEEIRKIYSTSEYSKEIFEKLFAENIQLRKECKELGDKLADAWFNK
jgi:hypothetical protein